MNSTVTPSAPSPALPVAMNDTSSFLLEIVAEHRIDRIYLYLPNGDSPSSLLSPLLVALDVAIRDATLNVAPGDGPKGEFVTVEMTELQSRVSLRNAEALEGRSGLPQSYPDVKNFQIQVQEIAAQGHEAKSAKRARHKRLQVDAMENRDRLNEAF